MTISLGVLEDSRLCLGWHALWNQSLSKLFCEFCSRCCRDMASMAANTAWPRCLRPWCITPLFSEDSGYSDWQNSGRQDWSPSFHLENLDTCFLGKRNSWCHTAQLSGHPTPACQRQPPRGTVRGAVAMVLSVVIKASVCCVSHLNLLIWWWCLVHSYFGQRLMQL